MKEWIKANPWKFAVICLAIGCVLLGGFGYGCGYVKGCNKGQESAEQK